MSPALEDGDYIFVIRPGTLRPGRIYMVNHIDLGMIVKRLSRLEDGRAYFTGDNKASTPNNLIAPVETSRVPNRIKGRAVLRISPKGISRV